MKLPDFTKDKDLNILREKLNANLNFLYKPGNNPIWDLKLEILLKKLELRDLEINEISVSSDLLLEYKQNKVLVYQKHQLERGIKGTEKYHFYNCATIKKLREDKKYKGKYIINRGAQFSVDIESFGKSIQKDVLINLEVCKNCLKESNYYNYDEVDYNMKNHIYKSFSIKEYFEAVD
ncbi:MAG: hypothetical protein Q9M94_01920 [Candidatus Gracilibacteria bacterium]|nr:hypothetical protein [Candidatus Gracilibacteria bacterium]MDQ7023749.1 hypothetical protein [Candidatus Gracilibacteria bacterium]